MKNFKLFSIGVLVALFASFIANAQSPTAGYGHQFYSQRQSTMVRPNGTVVLRDTLTASDTGYVQFSFPYKYNMVFDLSMRTLTGTLAGTAVLQCASGTTMPVPTSTLWHTVTGSTTYCAGCVGASATLTGSGTTIYQWHMPYDSNDEQFWQMRSITTGTSTATYSVTCGYKN